jgi:UDPglucose 6-dehydrogenase
MKIGIIGLGYVGLSHAMLFDKLMDVVCYDTDFNKISQLKSKKMVFRDSMMQEYLNNFHGIFTNDLNQLISSDFIIISTPTDYDETLNFFDTKNVDQSIKKCIDIGFKGTFVIKSTIPVGHTRHLVEKLRYNKIIFIPEFLREGQALYDVLNPSRIIIGSFINEAKVFRDLLLSATIKTNVKVLFTDSTEAEAIKLFSNSYLAMRIAFFNELDSYAELKFLNTKDIIEGICYDPRIGSYYNNPSFGYGGYCLPKDSKQLLANYEMVPQNIMTSIVESNYTRKKHIAEIIASKKPKLVGVYKLSMKTDSDNFRDSAIIDIIMMLKNKGINIIIYEPLIKSDTYLGFKVIHDKMEFIEISNLIVANRLDDFLKPLKEKVYTRSVFDRD